MNSFTQLECQLVLIFRNALRPSSLGHFFFIEYLRLCLHSHTFSVLKFSELPPDALLGHRSRFNSIFRQTKEFYETSTNLQYFKFLVSIPKLPTYPPNFLQVAHLSRPQFTHFSVLNFRFFSSFDVFLRLSEGSFRHLNWKVIKHQMLIFMVITLAKPILLLMNDL